MRFKSIVLSLLFSISAFAEKDEVDEWHLLPPKISGWPGMGQFFIRTGIINAQDMIKRAEKKTSQGRAVVSVVKQASEATSIKFEPKKKSVKFTAKADPVNLYVHGNVELYEFLNTGIRYDESGLNCGFSTKNFSLTNHNLEENFFLNFHTVFN